MTISPATFQSGDTLHFTNQNGIAGSYNSGNGVLTLTGTATPVQYQAALDSVTFSSTSNSPAVRVISTTTFDDGDSQASNTVSEQVIVSVPAIAAPVVTASGSTGQTFTLGQSAVHVDSGITATSADADLTGATETITNLQTGDTLIFSNQNGITGSYNSGTGVLTLTGSSTPGNYQTALQSVTFSSTSTVIGTRTIDVVATDSNASVTTSNTAVDTVVEAISAPVLTAGHAGIGYTAGETAKILDSGITVASADTNLTGATVTISAGSLQTGDTLSFTSPGGSGITGSYNSGTGTLTLSGSSSVANYQTALQSVTFVNSTSTSTSSIAALRSWSKIPTTPATPTATR